ncbi:MAG: hypothetical protein HY329_28090 [Chloroflexi bacterium]|nr:hypothetical protein [Chloroflexota bacterium]
MAAWAPQAASRRDRFYVSPLNFAPEVTAHERFAPRVQIHDVTIREGEQAADLAFTVDERVELAQAIAASGISQLQVGYAGDDDETVRALKRAGVPARVAVLGVAWKPNWQRAQATARDAGVDVLQVLVRSADRQLANLGLSRDGALRLLDDAVSHAVRLGFPVVMFDPSFSTTADWDHLLRMYAVAADAGAQRLAVVDSMGVAKPSVIAYMTREVRRRFGLPVTVHCHDDFGLVVANTVAGAVEGAEWLDASFLGVGERAGNCPLEELVLALEGLYGVGTGLRTEQLAGVTELVSRLGRTPIWPSKAVVGANSFAQKLDMHVKAAATDPSLMEPYDPTLVGNRRAIKLGRGSGPAAVGAKLAELGLELPPDLISEAVRLVNERATAAKASLSDDDIRRLVRELGDSGE